MGGQYCGVSSGVVLVPDHDQKSRPIIPYAVWFQLQESSPQDELYKVWNYPALKERDLQWLQRKVRHGVTESCMHTFNSPNCYSE
ncbi:hypothetical protein TNCV_955971 [Trichonephila clavipes]|nr:hypothetical protein TNCV_955971 [Trichonephila clavipes]